MGVAWGQELRALYTRTVSESRLRQLDESEGEDEHNHEYTRSVSGVSEPPLAAKEELGYSPRVRTYELSFQGT
jgi:hypothetical protein